MQAFRTAGTDNGVRNCGHGNKRLRRVRTAGGELADRYTSVRKLKRLPLLRLSSDTFVTVEVAAMGKVPIRLREVVYTLSPFEQTVMNGIWKDVPEKLHRKFSEASLFYLYH